MELLSASSDIRNVPSFGFAKVGLSSPGGSSPSGPAWIDLRLGGDVFEISNVTNTGLQTKSPQTAARDSSGLVFSGGVVWATCAKFWMAKAFRDDNLDCSMIIKYPRPNFMAGTCFDTTNMGAVSPYAEAETVTNMVTGGTSSSYGKGRSGGSPNIFRTWTPSDIVKLVFRTDGDGQFGSIDVYLLPGEGEADWDDESNLLGTTFLPSAGQKISTITMPFFVGQSGAGTKYIAVRHG